VVDLAISYIHVSPGKGGVSAAYIERGTYQDKNNRKFNYLNAGNNDVIASGVILPKGADSKFSDWKVLWLEHEKKEKRKDARISRNQIIALPKELNHEQMEEIIKRWCKEKWTRHGVATHYALHLGHGENQNPHAHIVITTRRIYGNEFDKYKATDLEPNFRGANSFIINKDNWHHQWTNFQNQYFKEIGLDLKVDKDGAIGQKHEGYTRENYDQSKLNKAIKKQNFHLLKDVEVCLEVLTQKDSVFTEKDLFKMLKKAGFSGNELKDQVEKVLSSEKVLALKNPETKRLTRFYTTDEVRLLEEKIEGYREKIEGFKHREVKIKAQNKTGLSLEQEKAYKMACGSGFSVIQGRAGVGKSYVLGEIRKSHEQKGYNVVALAPTNAVVRDLKLSGFKEAHTIFSATEKLKNQYYRLGNQSRVKNDKDGRIKRWGRNTLVVVDEAAMVDTKSYGELLSQVRRSGAKIVLAGDDRQLSAIERGGMFSRFSEKGQSVIIEKVRRQSGWQKTASEELSKGNFEKGLKMYAEKGKVHFCENTKSARSALVSQWKADFEKDKNKDRFVYAATNKEVAALNFEIRQFLAQKGHVQDGFAFRVGKKRDYFYKKLDSVSLERDLKLKNGTVLKKGLVGTVLKTHPSKSSEKWLSVQFGEEKVKLLVKGNLKPSRLNEKEILVGTGDKIVFTENVKSKGIVNGSRAKVLEAGEDKLRVKLENGKTLNFNPQKFSGFDLGYAGTVYKGQGKTNEAAYALYDSPYAWHFKTSYVGLTRHKTDFHLFAGRDKAKNCEELAQKMCKNDLNKSSLDYEALKIDRELVKGLKNVREGFTERFFKEKGVDIEGVFQKMTDKTLYRKSLELEKEAFKGFQPLKQTYLSLKIKKAKNHENWFKKGPFLEAKNLLSAYSEEMKKESKAQVKEYKNNILKLNKLKPVKMMGNLTKQEMKLEASAFRKVDLGKYLTENGFKKSEKPGVFETPPSKGGAELKVYKMKSGHYGFSDLKNPEIKGSIIDYKMIYEERTFINACETLRDEFKGNLKNLFKAEQASLTDKKEQKIDLDALKSKDLKAYLLQWEGFREVKGDKSKIERGEDEKLVITQKPSGHFTYFNVKDSSDRGTIFDYHLKRKEINFKEAAEKVQYRIGEGGMSVFMGNKNYVPPKMQAEKKSYEDLKVKWNEMESGYSAYLSKERGLSNKIYESDRFKGRIKLDDRKNVIFGSFDKEDKLVGFERRNRDFKSFEKGSSKALWASNRGKNDKVLVISESAIDALSYAQLKNEKKNGIKNHRFLATGGTWGKMAEERLILEIKSFNSKNITLAMDNDPAGQTFNEKLSTLIKTHAPEAKIHIQLPKSKDWNQDLKESLGLDKVPYFEKMKIAKELYKSERFEGTFKADGDGIKWKSTDGKMVTSQDIKEGKAVWRSSGSGKNHELSVVRTPEEAFCRQMCNNGKTHYIALGDNLNEVSDKQIKNIVEYADINNLQIRFSFPMKGGNDKFYERLEFEADKKAVRTDMPFADSCDWKSRFNGELNKFKSDFPKQKPIPGLSYEMNQRSRGYGISR